MKAALLTEFGSPLEVTTIPDPVLGTGEIIVDVVASHVLSYTGEVLRGERNYQLELPLAPGAAAVGQVRATGPDATRLKPGDWVLCDITVRSRDDLRTPDIALQGWSARGEGGRQLMRHFRHGAFAAQMMIPTENAIPLGPVRAADAGRWCALDLLLVPYGGLVAADLQAGETVLVSGATGNYGSAGVAVALAMGAARVVAPGRNEKVLDDLARRFGDRVRTVQLTGEPDEDQRGMRSAAAGPIDVVLDLLPPAAGTAPVRVAAMTVREFGRVVLMGGVGMLGGDDLALP
jgi:alcohol dehydrogenase